MSGKCRRLKRLFRQPGGRAILTPIDHGLWFGPMPGIESPVAVTRAVIEGSDGLLIAPGFARAVRDILPSDRALALRVGTSTALSPVQSYESLFAGIETALRLDADAVVHTLYLGSERDERAIRDLGTLIEAAARYDMPVIAEFLPCDANYTPEMVAHWARLGFELGADVIKTMYTGDVASFARVVMGCGLPVLIAGGPMVGTEADLLRTVSEAIKGGAAGTAIGRRVWQSRDPTALLALFGQLVHGTRRLDQVLAMLPV